MKRTELKPAIQRVNAHVVAAFLGIKDTTVYTLCKGLRGWSQIEPLPHDVDPDASRRNRLTFDLNAVAEWKVRNDFKVQPQGRGKRRPPDTQAAA